MDVGQQMPEGWVAGQSLSLCENFLSIEGEGQWIGYPVTLIRFSGCNLRCTFCDTKFSSWYTDDRYVKSVDDIYNFCLAQGAKMVSLTGGEPMWRIGEGEMDAMLELVKRLHGAGYYIKVETNGLCFDERFLRYIALWSISPKLAGMGNNEKGSKTYFDPAILKQFIDTCYSDQIQLKFVVGMRDRMNTFEADMADIKKVMEDNPKIKEAGIPVVLQPEGLTQDLPSYIKRCANLCEQVVLNDPLGFWKEYNLRILPQFHRLMWNNERQK